MDDRIEEKDELSEKEKQILDGGTEPRFSGEHLDTTEEGIFRCVRCKTELFDTKAKFDSGTGWPSFYDIVSGENVATRIDKSHGMKRVEVLCGECDGHLGHVFDDGPEPTGKRYCINSAVLDFSKEE